MGEILWSRLLRIYRKVFVDLVAPAELALPKMYEDRMVARGYVVRRWFEKMFCEVIYQ